MKIKIFIRDIKTPKYKFTKFSQKIQNMSDSP